MYNDIESPGCYYDVTDCNGQCCEAGRKMYERYLEEKYGVEEDTNQKTNTIMKFEVYFVDIDPDSGDITQEIVVAEALNEDYAKSITDHLGRADMNSYDDPNREYKYRLKSE
jgi:hypothetical protein